MLPSMLREHVVFVDSEALCYKCGSQDEFLNDVKTIDAFCLGGIYIRQYCMAICTCSLGISPRIWHT